MGLLDDAIREHLELKRLKGADPGQVAREEHEALGPVGHTGAESDQGYQEPPERMASGEEMPPAQSSEGVSDEMPFASRQETVEFDMDSVVREDHAPRPDSPAGQEEQATVGSLSPSNHVNQDEAPPSDSLEWEVPNDRDQPPDEHGNDLDDPNRDKMEDVLEETPDFLRETPEQDRLWFEQRPPRDFDFNE